jgi:peptidoglycan-associated lipoprotein
LRRDAQFGHGDEKEVSDMSTASKLAMITMLAVSVAACAPKPKNLPPPPPTSNTEGTNTTPSDTGNVGVATPGSKADFLAKAGSDTVHFGTDLYDIDATAGAILDAQAAWLNQYPNVRITIEGHCDERGTREYNLALGDRRANAAKNYLAGKGISPSRMTTISYGKERPVAMGSDEESWAQNRRAVTVLISGMAG